MHDGVDNDELHVVFDALVDDGAHVPFGKEGDFFCGAVWGGDVDAGVFDAVHVSSGCDKAGDDVVFQCFLASDIEHVGGCSV